MSEANGMPTRTVQVECRFTLPVEVPADWDDHRIRFAVEENGCPATGAVGAALNAAIERHDESGTCWACACQGHNRVLGPSLRDLLVYVASPISQGGLADNIRRAHDAGLALMRAGLTPMVPHGSCFLGNRVVTHLSGNPDYPQAFIPEVLSAGLPYEDWIAASLVLVRRCDAVLRLPGVSKGADLETAEARSRGIPVFASVEEMLTWAKESAA